MQSLPPRPCFAKQTCFPHFFLPKFLYCVFNCSNINIFTPIHCLNVATDDVGKNFSHCQELNRGTLFESHILTEFHFDWHRTGVMDSCGFKVMYGGGETSRNCREPELSSFHYYNEKYDTEGKIFSARLTTSMCCCSLGDLWLT